MSFWFKRVNSVRYMLGFLISLVLILIHIFFDVLPVITKLDGKTLNYLPATMWIGTTITGNFTYLFYILMPLFSVIGLNIICYEDRQADFIRRFTQHRGIKKYCTTNFILSFMSGCLIVGIPLLVDYLTVLCLFPNIVPDNLINIDLGITHRSMYFSWLYFSHPSILIIIYIIGTSCLGGLYSCIAATFSLYLKTLYAGLAATFLGVIGISLISTTFHGAFPMLLTLPKAIASNPILPSLVFLIIFWIVSLLGCFILFIRGVKRNVTI